MMGFYIACASLVVLALGLAWLQPPSPRQDSDDSGQ